MQIVNVHQGSPEWHAHRLNHFNASDAPAMMGCSPYKTRAELIREVATGLTAEVDPATQRLFDDGHRTEALARPIAEKIIGAELYPVVGSNGALSASFDGLTIDDRIGFECKRLNKRLREAMQPGCTGADLPLDYQVQMEQQHAVNEAGERTLFVAAHFDDAGQIIEERHCWYVPNPELRAQILAGWAQFEKDVAAYVPTEAPEPAKADTMESLPAVSVRLDGALSVAGNLPAFGEALRAFIAKIPAKPATDNEFATVDAACKALKKAEEALDAAEAGALASITDVEAMRRAVADCRKLARDTRLAAEKLVERRKVEMKEQAVMAARRALADHVDALSAELAPIRVQMPAVDFALAIKGLRSIASMQDALDTELANGKIAADAQARTIRANRAAMDAAEAGHLFPDFAQVCTKAAEDFANLIVSRKAAAQARLEAERERIRAEEAARLEREAAAKRAAEEREQREAAERLAAQERAAAAAAAEVERLAAERRAREEAATLAAQQQAQPAPAPAPAPEVRAFPPAAPAANEVPTMTLGQLNARLGFTCSADFLEGLGFVAHRDRAARLYRPSQVPAIKRALIEHIEAVPDEVPLAA